MTLGEAQGKFYSDNGYLVVEDVVGEAELDGFREAIAEFRERASLVERSDDLFDLGPGHGPDSPKLRRIKNPADRHPAFGSLMRSDRLVDIVAQLLGGTARFDHSKLNFKPPRGNAKIEWHQDWAFYPHTNDDLLAVGVMLEDCDEENGPLQVIPGSHRGPVHDHHLDGMFVGGIAEDSLGDALGEAVSLTAKAGSISIHHVRTLHASSENRSDRERPLLLFSYAAVDAFPVFAKVDLEEFDSRILRGEPTVVPRAAAVPMRLPQPRAAGADSIFDNQAALAAT